MDERELRRLKKALPSDFRLKWIPADLEGPAEIVMKFPDTYVFQYATKRGFLGFFRGWKTFANIKQYWPAEADDEIRLLNEKFEEFMHAVLERAELDDKVKISIVRTHSSGHTHGGGEAHVIPGRGLNHN